MTHLDTLELRLSNERIRFENSKTEAERTMRQVWINQMQKEIEGEKDFIKLKELSIDELANQLNEFA
jgi:hypothetical protein